MSSHVLIIDDDQSCRESCAEVLESLRVRAEVAESVSRALGILERQRIDTVLADAEMPGLNGLELLRIIKQKCPEIDVVIMAEGSTIPLAAQAVRQGACGYIRKPLKMDDLKDLFRRLGEKKELGSHERVPSGPAGLPQALGDLIGASAQMQRVYRLITKVAGKRHPVLILGESGTGKELVARAIHAYGPWHAKPFLPVDCGALTPTLIESELFGHVRGAFTGATQSRPGLLATAGDGTIFLDEIAELPPELQAKLLRALQEREFRPVGSNQRTRLEARIIAATNQDLEAAVRRGRFRKDLYFRLNVVRLKIPPLRDRRSDIPALIHFFTDRHGGPEAGIGGVSPEALARLINYDWPGNVRELENCIQRALALGSGPLIQVKDLPSNLLYQVGVSPGGLEVATLRELERRAIVQALEATGGDRLRAAKLLGIGKTTIYRKLKEYGLENTRDFTSAI